MSKQHTIPILKISLRPVVLAAVFEAMGPSKNAYFEDVFKMAKKLLKMSKNGPKMIPKWFKIPKLLKIAPKIRPHEDL